MLIRGEKDLMSENGKRNRSAERLNLLLKEKKMQKKVLADKICVTAVTVSKWANGKANITEDNAQRIVKVLMDKPDRYSEDWLLGKTDFRYERDYIQSLFKDHELTAQMIQKAYEAGFRDGMRVAKEKDD